MNYLDNIVQDKPAIILDIGHAYTKCGFAGEAAPYSIIPSKVSKDIGSNKSVNIYDLLNDEEYLKETIVEFLYRIYYKILNANARDRKVVVVESVLTPSVFRKVLADVLFNNFLAASVLFLPSHLASLYTLGISTGLVIDCGYSDCQIMPVSHGIPMSGLCDFVSLGADKIHSELNRLIKEHVKITLDNNKIPFSKVNPQLTKDTIEDIKIRCCFVSNFERSRQFLTEFKSIDQLRDNNIDLSKSSFKFAPECDYNLLDNMILHIPGYLREFAFEIMFIDHIDNKLTVPNLILDTLVRCPIDLKKELMKNVVLVGGNCLLAGFKHRLVSELNYLIKDKDYSDKLPVNYLKFHSPPSIDNYTAWLGGSVFGALDILDSYSILSSKYKEMERLPDWFTVSNKNEMVNI